MGENKRFATFDFFKILFACGIIDYDNWKRT